MLDLGKKSSLFIRTIGFFGYFDCIYSIQNNNLEKREQCSCSHYTAEPGVMHAGNMRAPQTKLQGDSVKWKSAWPSRSSQQMYCCFLMNNELPFWVRSLETEVCTTHLFTQANPESTALKIYFTLCLIYIQKIYHSQLLLVFSSVEGPKPAEFYS